MNAPGQTENAHAPRRTQRSRRPQGASQRSHRHTSRRVLQISMVLVILAGVTVRNLGISAGWIPEIRGVCPFGAMQNVLAAVTGRGTLFWFPAGVLLAALILGPVFCGRLCPLGSVQEWVGRLGRRLFGKRYNTPVPGDRYLKHLRWVLPVVMIAGTAGLLSMQPDMLNISYALFHVWTAVVPVSAVVVLAGVLVASLRIERPWCRWICPWGAVLGVISRVSPWTIRRNSTTCISCTRCARACPFHIPVDHVAAVRDSRCNRCEACVAACPVAGALQWEGPRGTLPLRRGVTISVATVALVLLPLVPAALLPRATAASAQGGEAVAPTTLVTVSPTMTLADLALLMAVDTAELLEILGIPEGVDTSLMLIDLEEEPGLESVTVGFIREQVEALQ